MLFKAVSLWHILVTLGSACVLTGARVIVTEHDVDGDDNEAVQTHQSNYTSGGSDVDPGSLPLLLES